MSEILFSGISPITFFPIRLETRFYPYKRKEGTKPDELHIRIYPDIIHIDSHEKELTEFEKEMGKQFWTQLLNAENNVNIKDDLWNQLVSTLGAERASWVARIMKPNLNNAIEFPNVELKDSSWTRPALVRLLPTKWRAVAILGNQKITAVGKNIITPLPISIDPLSTKTEIDWLIDFNKALDAGMAIKLPLSSEMKTNGIDRLLVYGIKENQNGASGAEELKEVLNAHYYTDGFGYIEPGTPTNNTENTFSGYDKSDPQYISGYSIFEQDDFNSDEKSSASRTAKYMGISLSQTGQFDEKVNSFVYAANRHCREELFSEAVNEGLWASTWGYFLSQMLVESEGEYASNTCSYSKIEERAYFNYLERERLKREDWLKSELEAIAEVVYNEQIYKYIDKKTYTREEALKKAENIQKGYESWDTFLQQWVYARKQANPYININVEALRREIIQTINFKAYIKWKERGSIIGDRDSDWIRAEKQLYLDRVSKYAYLRWEWRNSIKMDDSPENDWYAGERALSYSADSIKVGRKHFTKYVRPGGPLPAIRIANQPYGVLPVMSLDNWKPSENENNLEKLVKAINVLKSKVWLPSVSNVPRIGCNENETENKELSDLLTILMTSPLSQEFDASMRLSYEFVKSILRITNKEVSGNWEMTLNASNKVILDALGISWLPRINSFVGTKDILTVSIPLIGEKDKEILDWFVGSKNVTLLEALKNDDEHMPDNLKNSKSLLYLLLRHSCLRELVDAAISILKDNNKLKDWEHLDADLINMKIEDSSEPSRIVWELFNRRITIENTVINTNRPIRANTITVGTYIEKNYKNCSEDSPLYGLRKFMEAVETIKDASYQQIDRLVRQTLDSASHRLDAWITSFATRRLSEIRDRGIEGTLIGGFGWVEDLKAQEGEHSNAQSNTNMNKTQDGFIHAPSIRQAITAGVLRSAYLAHASDNGNSCAINLSSSRVRKAEWLLDGMRQGQTLSSLLGYLFEKELHKGQADEYIDDFRVIAPLEAEVIESSDDASGANSYVLSKPNTLDGLKLHEMWKDNSSNPAIIDLLDNIKHNSLAKYNLVVAALDALEDAFDCVSDALIAESVHHTVNGNPERASAILNMLSKGEGPIPQLEFTKTPRTGKNISHRIIALKACGFEISGLWNTSGRHRAVHSQELEAQVQKLLPSPKKVRCKVKINKNGKINKGEELMIDTDIYLSECELCALDYVYEARTGSDVIPLIIKLSIIAAACKKNNIPLDFSAEVEYAVNKSFSPDEITVPEFMRVCALVRQVLGKSRALTPDDFVSPEAGYIEQVEDMNLTASAQSANNLLRRLHDRISQYITSDEIVSTEEAYMLFTEASELGINGAAEAAVKNTKESAYPVEAEIKKRIKELDSLINSESGISNGAAQENNISDINKYNIEIIRTVFGGEFLVTPRFNILNADTFNEAVYNGRKIATSSAVRRWFGNMSRVHGGAAVFNRYLLAGSALRINIMNSFSAIQLPVIQNEKWVGNTLNENGIDGSRLNLVIFGEKLQEDYNSVSGFVIDEWNETIPNKEETTGIAFHYDSPGSEPPQTILIAVQPDINDKKWTTDMLEMVLHETLELAKIRSVGRNELNDLGQILPAIYLTNNLNKDTVSTELFPME
ncbi:hypothetical protein EHE19_009630 [Ruminiclostridium herbifermentans]|uniref:Uncharacterized protein n=1 Tax=Ruminiclostridium herbifermentans TaxID=2488810 RepID=A0A4U7JIW2_9FIRM|nr:hypothetical protein [Ruminiclostridium herbifermentans]QNU68628.1 hypothetical protein EHE19_009630 [Ruminiclostridium herbifermentans]